MTVSSRPPKKLFPALMLAIAGPTVAMVLSLRIADDARHTAERQAEVARQSAQAAEAQAAAALNSLGQLRASIACKADVDRRVSTAEIDFLIAIYDGRDATAERGRLQRSRDDRAAAEAACGG